MIETTGPVPVTHLPGVPKMTTDTRPRRLPRVTSAALAAAGFAAALLVVQAVVTAESWAGLTGYAHLIGITGPAAWGVPVTLDGVSLIAALIALRAELAGESSAAARLTLLAFTLASASANYWHGARSGGAPAALYFGAMSIAVALVFALVLRQIRREDRRRAGALTDRLPRFSAAHWLRYPRLTGRAWSLAVLGGLTAREALTAARQAEVPAVDLDAEALAAMPKRDRLLAAFGAVGALDVPAALAYLEARGAALDSSHAYQIRRSLTGGE